MTVPPPTHTHCMVDVKTKEESLSEDTANVSFCMPPGRKKAKLFPLKEETELDVVVQSRG